MTKRLVLAIALFTAINARSESWTTTKRVCGEAFSRHTLPSSPEPAWRFHTFEECAIDFFTLDPIGPAIGNIATGSSFGGGLHGKYAFNANRVATMKALYTLNSSNLLSGQYEMFFSPIRPIEIKGPNGRPGQTDETKATVDFKAERLDLHSQDFYGLGPSSSLAGHAVYRYVETSIGMDGYMPLPYVSGRPGIIGVLGGVKYLRPVAKGLTGDSVPSVNQLYGESGAPGSTLRPDFFELFAGLSIRTPYSKPIIWERHEAQIMYSHYFDRESNQFSFDRLEAWANVSIDLLKKAKTNGRWSRVDYNRSRWKDVLCMQNAVGGCLIGTLTMRGRVTTSYTAGGSTVPFYLQPTLGGTDLYGVDTLRGLVDYRLRAPNRILLQTDFDKPIAQIGLKKHPLGQYGLYGFFDAGNVAPTPGQLVANGLRTDEGVGFSVSIQNKIVFRVYIGFGAGEGSHPNAKSATFF
jgi:hypothetical protein